ncbi:MAG TPA: hypothetical protein VIM11_01995 [Tepidisphaeraceae bacterium]|jgi:hypothetical protein
MPHTLSHPRDKALMVLSLLLLAGAGIDRLAMSPSQDATRYHARVREVYDQTPNHFGPWVGTPCDEPAEAIDLLKPNVIVSQAFEDKEHRRKATFLLVQCSDVRDMISHYPPICYKNRGLIEPVPRQLINWKVDDLDVQGTEYQFESETLQSSQITIVDNFMVLPNGRVVENMDEVKKRLKLDVRYFGVAQVQIVFDGSTLPEERKQIGTELIRAHMNLINVIRSGVR